MADVKTALKSLRTWNAAVLRFHRLQKQKPGREKTGLGQDLPLSYWARFGIRRGTLLEGVTLVKLEDVSLPWQLPVWWFARSFIHSWRQTRTRSSHGDFQATFLRMRASFRINTGLRRRGLQGPLLFLLALDWLCSFRQQGRKPVYPVAETRIP